MSAVRTVADGRERWLLSTTKPDGPSIAALPDAIDISCELAKSSSRISATASDTVTDSRLCDEANAPAFGASNYEGTAAPFWLLDPDDGTYSTADNPAFEALKEKGTVAWITKVTGIKRGVTLAAGYMSSCYEVVTDTPQSPTGQGEYIKSIIPLSVTPVWDNELLTATSP